MLKKYSHAVMIWIVTLRLPAPLVPVVSLKRASATGTLNALASAIGVAAITMIAIAIMASMSFLLDFDLAGVGISFSDFALRETFGIRFCYFFRTRLGDTLVLSL